jgi:hypothetical protein
MQTNPNEQYANDSSLNLTGFLEKYSGLEIVETTRAINVGVEHTETIQIVEWVRLDFLESPLLKRDFPQMGFVSYSEAPTMNDGQIPI